MNDYMNFLKKKQIKFEPSGLTVKKESLNSMLFPFQADLVDWSLKKGKSCIFADCGLGKTPMQLEWAEQICRKHNSSKILILAPLAVSRQTKREGDKFGIKVNICNHQEDVKPGVNITNYEKMHHFNSSEFRGLVLDESSILKSFTGKIRSQIIELYADVPYKLACTATPSPNDYMELGNHSEFLGVMTRTEMLAMFFVHDGSDVSKWRLKGHAQDKYWEWLSSWAVVLRSPSDLGYEDNGFILPPLTINTHYVNAAVDDEYLFAMNVNTLAERRKARKLSLIDRVELIATKVNKSTESALIWCDYNAESEMLKNTIHDAVEVKGPDTIEHKENAMLGFASGEVRVMVTKPSIAGYGMNWQVCHQMAFCGLSDSYEQYYQAIRRCWRFGQQKPVTVDVVISENEETVLQNIRRKEADAMRMAEHMVKYTHGYIEKDIHQTDRRKNKYKTNQKMEAPKWAM